MAAGAPALLVAAGALVPPVAAVCVSDGAREPPEGDVGATTGLVVEMLALLSATEVVVGAPEDPPQAAGSRAASSSIDAAAAVRLLRGR